MWFSSFPLLQTRGLNSSANSKFCDKRASHTETTTTLFTTFCSRRLEQPALLESLAVVRGPRAAPEPLPQSSAPAGLTHRPCYWSRRPRRRRRPLAPGRTGWCWCRWHSSARWWAWCPWSSTNCPGCLAGCCRLSPKSQTFDPQPLPAAAVVVVAAAAPICWCQHCWQQQGEAGWRWRPWCCPWPCCRACGSCGCGRLRRYRRAAPGTTQTLWSSVTCPASLWLKRKSSHSLIGLAGRGETGDHLKPVHACFYHALYENVC